MRMINELTDIMAELSHYSICEDSDYIKSMENKLRKTKKGTELSFNHWKQGLTKGTFQGLGTLGGKPFAKISTKTRSHWVPVHHVNEEKYEVNFKYPGVRTGGFKSVTVDAESETHAKKLAKKQFDKLSYGAGYRLNDVRKIKEDVTGETDVYSVKKSKTEENHWDVFHNGKSIGHIKKGTSAARAKGAIRRGGTGKSVTTWSAHLDHDKKKESQGWVGRYTTFGHPTKDYALAEIKRWHKKPESTNEEIKGWKHAGRDLSKWRAEKGNTVKLVALKKDGNESKMHDATTSYTSLDYARRHHDNKVKLNPGRSIRHNVYVDGKLHDTWG